jgi:hypothetical protein
MAYEKITGDTVPLVEKDGAGGHKPVVLLPASTETIGATRDAGPSQTVTRTYSTAADGSTAFDATATPTTGQKILLLDLIVSVDTACLVTLQMESSGNVLAAFYMAANSSIQITPRGYLKGDAANKKLQLKTSVASAIKATSVYTSEA